MILAKFSHFRKNPEFYLDKVSEDVETLFVNRAKDAGIVVMTLETYNSLVATNHEISSRKNEVRLDSATAKLKK